MQSHNEVLDFIKAGDFVRAPVLSVAPQTLASLSASYAGGQIPLRTLLRRIRAFLAAPERGGWQVWDTTFARHVALREMVTEFQERRAAAEAGEKMQLPMLASACPGWVCYAEKAQGDLLPLMSAARSPQGVMGALVKQWYARRLDRTPAELYHVTAMPCYDKKLEASREDFYSEAYKTRDTDCVLTTGELDLLLHELGFDPLSPVAGEDAADPDPFPELLQHPGSSSGSYLGSLLSALAAAHPLPTRVHTRAVRGSTDNVEVYLEDSEGAVLFKGAICYGFRNLQNLVRKVGRETGIGRARPAGAGRLQAAVAARRRKARTGQGELQTPATPASPVTPGGEARTGGDDVAGAALVASRDAKKLDFVEVMACPGGCVNGGGQMKPGATAVDAEGYERPLPDDGVAEPPRSTGLASEEGMRWSTKEWVAEVERVYWTGLPTPPASPRIQAQDAAPAQWPARTRAADGLAEQVVADMLGAAGGDRHACVRTRFKRVEGDVLSQGGLTHEQVKW
jgi:iron only hydrogenase large subunit-like protein